MRSAEPGTTRSKHAPVQARFKHAISGVRRAGTPSRRLRTLASRERRAGAWRPRVGAECRRDPRLGVAGWRLRSSVPRQMLRRKSLTSRNRHRIRTSTRRRPCKSRARPLAGLCSASGSPSPRPRLAVCSERRSGPAGAATVLPADDAGPGLPADGSTQAQHQSRPSAGDLGGRLLGSDSGTDQRGKTTWLQGGSTKTLLWRNCQVVLKGSSRGCRFRSLPADRSSTVAGPRAEPGGVV